MSPAAAANTPILLPIATPAAAGSSDAPAGASAVAIEPPPRARHEPASRVAAGARRTGDDDGAPDRHLAAERARLEVARSALARGDTAGALAAIEQHARQFPRGRLEEEREALRIQALVRAGRSDAARERAVAFRERFPQSLLAPAADAAIGSIP